MDDLRVDVANIRSSQISRTIASSYNAAGELVSVSDPSATINLTRDNLGRATSVQNILGSASALQFTFQQTFDAVHQRTELRAAHGLTNDFRNTYAYDKLGRLTSVAQSGQSGGNAVVNKRVDLDYNALGQRTKLSRFESVTRSVVVQDTRKLPL
jgi:YD repeat-containing protein